jgi:hypothetical protein
LAEPSESPFNAAILSEKLPMGTPAALKLLVTYSSQDHYS